MEQHPLEDHGPHGGFFFQAGRDCLAEVIQAHGFGEESIHTYLLALFFDTR